MCASGATVRALGGQTWGTGKPFCNWLGRRRSAMRCSARTCAARDSPSRAALTDRIQAQFDESGEARVTCRNAAGRYVALDAVLAEMRQDEEWAGCFNQPQA